MPKISTRSDSIGARLAEHEPFTTHGGLSAVTDPPTSTGRLPYDWRNRYRADADTPGIAYVVLSYATPIAWFRKDGLVVIPAASYSQTTTRHQGIVRRWLRQTEAPA